MSQRRELLTSVKERTSSIIKSIVGFTSHIFFNATSHLDATQGCTCQLLNARYVLTAAHCFFSRDVNGFMNRPYKTQVKLPHAPDYVDIESYDIHPFYKPLEAFLGQYAEFDFAVIKLANPVSDINSPLFCTHTDCAFCRNCGIVSHDPELTLVGHFKRDTSKPFEANLVSSPMRVMPTQLVHHNSDNPRGEYSYTLYKGSFTSQALIEGGDSGGGLFKFSDNDIFLTAITITSRDTTIESRARERLASTTLILPWIFSKSRYNNEYCPLPRNEYNIIYINPCNKYAECNPSEQFVNPYYNIVCINRDNERFCRSNLGTQKYTYIKRIRFLLGAHVELTPIYMLDMSLMLDEDINKPTIIDGKHFDCIERSTESANGSGRMVHTTTRKY